MAQFKGGLAANSERNVRRAQRAIKKLAPPDHARMTGWERSLRGLVPSVCTFCEPTLVNGERSCRARVKVEATGEEWRCIREEYHEKTSEFAASTHVACAVGQHAICAWEDE